MRSVATFLVVAVLAFSGVLPLNAQLNRSRSERSEKGVSIDPVRIEPTARTPRTQTVEPGIRFASIEAYSDGSGTFIRWSMEREAGNLGFYVYRIDTKGRTLLNDSLIGGSAMSVNDQMLAGTQYRYFDPAGDVGSTYIIETILTNGGRIEAPAVSAAYVGDLAKVNGADEARRRESAISGTNGQRMYPGLPKDVQLAVEESLIPPDPQMQKWVVQQPGVRIAVREEGMYRVTADDLAAAGFNTSEPDNWQLYKDGVQQAIIVGPKGAYIEFYGKGLDRIETDEQMYFLINGTAAGKRMGTRVMRRVGSGVTTRNYDVALNKKERTSYVNSILNGPLDNFWGRVIFATATTIPFDVTGIDHSRPEVSLTVFMQGYSITAHSISVKLNGTTLGTITGFGRASYNNTFTFPTSLLVEGSNGLTLQSSGSTDTNLFDQLTLTYSRKFIANNGELSFYTQAYRGVNLGGFTSPDVRLVDLTLDGEPRLLTGVEFEDDGSGTYSAALPAYRPRTLYAFEDSALLSPVSISSYDTTPLTDPKGAADLIIISYKDFMDESEAWADYRRGQGFAVKVVDVDEIYDEFNYGAAGAEGVTSYLHYAFDNWETPPSYVLLIGDASYDPRGYEGIGRFNLVPTKFVNTIFSETGSDEALADFNNDGFAEIAIGRIPARTVGTATHTLNKVMSFEVPAMQDLSRGVLMAHDRNDGWDFDQMSVRVASELPEGTPITYVSRDDPTAQADVIANINQAKYLVNYTGHGSSGAWAAVSFFSVLNEPDLTNTDQSLFTMLTCLNGYFVGNQNDSFSEVLVKSDHGAVAAWASAGLTTPDVQEVMAKRFFHQIGQGDITRLGDLIKDAKSVIPGGTDVRLSWVLIGDPMLQVR
jgi:hypothetical protein